MTELAITRRIRSTIWSSRIEDFGIRAYTVYNHMLLPTQVRGVEADYHHLRSAVQVWDVACERQVELHGPDAARLAQLLTVRDLSGFVDGRCGYAPVVDHDGRLINDPVVLRVAHDRWWFSVSDSDVVLWAGGLAHGMGLDVRVSEPNVNPLAVQGPHSEAVMAAVFGESVRAITTKLGSVLASTAALMRSTISSLETISLLGRWPQRFCATWSSRCTAAAPAS